MRCEDLEQGVRWIDAVLADPQDLEADPLRAHTNSCDGCQQVLLKLTHQLQTMRHLPASPPVELEDIAPPFAEAPPLPAALEARLLAIPEGMFHPRPVEAGSRSSTPQPPTPRSGWRRWIETWLAGHPLRGAGLVLATASAALLLVLVRPAPDPTLKGGDPGGAFSATVIGLELVAESTEGVVARLDLAPFGDGTAGVRLGRTQVFQPILRSPDHDLSVETFHWSVVAVSDSQRLELVARGTAANTLARVDGTAHLYALPGRMDLPPIAAASSRVRLFVLLTSSPLTDEALADSRLLAHLPRNIARPWSLMEGLADRFHGGLEATVLLELP